VAGPRAAGGWAGIAVVGGSAGPEVAAPNPTPTPFWFGVPGSDREPHRASSSVAVATTGGPANVEGPGPRSPAAATLVDAPAPFALGDARTDAPAPPAMGDARADGEKNQGLGSPGDAFAADRRTFMDTTLFWCLRPQPPPPCFFPNFLLGRLRKQRQASTDQKAACV
jgi:hypothetical protein